MLLGFISRFLIFIKHGEEITIVNGSIFRRGIRATLRRPAGLGNDNLHIGTPGLLNRSVEGLKHRVKEVLELVVGNIDDDVDVASSESVEDFGVGVGIVKSQTSDAVVLVEGYGFGNGWAKQSKMLLGFIPSFLIFIKHGKEIPVIRGGVIHGGFKAAGRRPAALGDNDGHIGTAGLLHCGVHGVHHGVEEVEVPDRVWLAVGEQRERQRDIVRVASSGKIRIYVG
nr:hypothetical protein Iba_chr12aCG6580 [Ipomoea batatas]